MKRVIMQSIRILLIHYNNSDSSNEKLNVEITRTNESLCQRIYFEIRLRLLRFVGKVQASSCSLIILPDDIRTEI